MPPFDAKIRPRNPNVLTARNLFMLGLVTLGLISCAQQTSAQPVLVEPTPIIQPAVTETHEMPIIITTQEIIPSPTPLIITPTPDVPPTRIPISIYEGSPPQWATGETPDQLLARMTSIIKPSIDSFNQLEQARLILPEHYLNAVVNIQYEIDPSEKPDGGTATFIGINPNTNESIFITDSHVLYEGSRIFHIKQPHNGLDSSISLTDPGVVVARAPSGDFGDLAVVKLPFIPQGVTAFPVVGNDLCTYTQPQAYTGVKGFSYPYINITDGGNGFSPYLAVGAIEEVGDANTAPTTCWREQASGYLGIPTTVPTRPGSSGTLLLDDNNVAVGLIRAVSPHGAVVTPLNAEILSGMIAQTGFVSP